MNKRISAMTPKRAGRETMELSDEELPPLPTHAGRMPWNGLRFGKPGYTADQMREYARAILAAHEAKKQQDHLTQPCGVRTEPGEENARGVKEDRK